jgi:hypothetical protein
MLCTIWGFYGSDYEDVVFWDINSVRTSQETYNLSATESSQLILCKIWCVHGDDYEE